jgi:heme A synthase
MPLVVVEVLSSLQPPTCPYLLPVVVLVLLVAVRDSRDKQPNTALPVKVVVVTAVLTETAAAMLNTVTTAPVAVAVFTAMEQAAVVTGISLDTVL